MQGCFNLDSASSYAPGPPPGGLCFGDYGIFCVSSLILFLLKPEIYTVRLSLSRPCLSRITAYLAVKIWSLFYHGNLTTGNKILWKRGEIAPKEQFNSPLFHNIFNISLNSGVKLHIHLWNVVVRFIFSSILQIWYVKVRISRSISESPLDFEITRIDCMYYT